MTNASDVLQTVISIRGHAVRLTVKQWMHIIEAHDYMAGNMDKVLETLADPLEVIDGKDGESLALREYPQTNITRKTAVVVYRDEPGGFVITAFLTSRVDKLRRKGQRNG
jgi:hypothetical protein